MIELLLFMFPAGLSLRIKDDFFKEDLKIKDYVLIFMKYAVIINLIMFVFLFLWLNGKAYSMSAALDDLDFVFKYIVLSTILAVIVPVLEEYFRKCIKFKISIKNIEVRNVKKNK